MILLWDMPFEVMLVINHASSIKYQNQVGGVVCAIERLEGVLASLAVGAEDIERIMNLPYSQGAEGINTEIADTIDAVLSSDPRTAFVKVDRARLDESWEAWVYVLIETPEGTDPVPGYSGSVYGFGSTKGVLTWPNSD